MKMTTTQIIPVALDLLVAGDNDRTAFDETELRTLADSLETDGLAQPITVRPHPDPLKRGLGFFEIVAGERRSRAARLLGWQAIPAIVRELTDEQAAAIMLVENVQRVDLNPMDEAKAYQKRMQQFGWTVAEVARRSKKTARHVGDRLALLELVPEVQDLIRSKQLEPSWGVLMSNLDNNRQRIALRYLLDTERPLLREFRVICGKLSAEQAQESMFDINDFLVQVVADHNSQEAERKLRGGKFPVATHLPEFKRTGTVAESLENYIALLLTQAHAKKDKRLADAATIVGALYEGMLATGFAFAPHKETQLDKLRF